MITFYSDDVNSLIYKIRNTLLSTIAARCMSLCSCYGLFTGLISFCVFIFFFVCVCVCSILFYYCLINDYCSFFLFLFKVKKKRENRTLFNWCRMKTNPKNKTIVNLNESKLFNWYYDITIVDLNQCRYYYECLFRI